MSTTPDELNINDLLCSNIYGLNRSFGRLYQALFGETGFTYPKFLVLHALKNHGPQSLSDLAAHVGSEANTLSPMVKRMSEFGLLERVRDSKDERRVLLTLMPYGEKMLAEANKVVVTAWAQLDLDRSEIETALTTLADARKKVDALKPTELLQLPER